MGLGIVIITIHYFYSDIWCCLVLYCIIFYVYVIYGTYAMHV